MCERPLAFPRASVRPTLCARPLALPCWTSHAPFGADSPGRSRLPLRDLSRAFSRAFAPPGVPRVSEKPNLLRALHAPSTRIAWVPRAFEEVPALSVRCACAPGRSHALLRDQPCARNLWCSTIGLPRASVRAPLGDRTCLCAIFRVRALAPQTLARGAPTLGLPRAPGRPRVLL